MCSEPLETRRFSLGRSVATPGALSVLQELGISPVDLLLRHARGDWPSMSEQDQIANRLAARFGGRVFSSFDLGPAEHPTTIWVITEWDRSVTTLLLPSEY